MEKVYILAYCDDQERIFLKDQVMNNTRFFSLKKGARSAKKTEALFHFPSSELETSFQLANSLQAEGLRKVALLVEVAKKSFFLNRIEQGYIKSYIFLEKRKAKNILELSAKEAYIEKLLQSYDEQGYLNLKTEKGEILKIMDTPYLVAPQCCLEKGGSFKVKEAENLKSVQNIIIQAHEVEVFEKEHLDRPAHLTYACPETRSVIIFYLD